MICSTLTPNHSGKENPCYTQIRLQKIRILEIRELHNGWLQCGLGQIATIKSVYPSNRVHGSLYFFHGTNIQKIDGNRCCFFLPMCRIPRNATPILNRFYHLPNNFYPFILHFSVFLKNKAYSVFIVFGYTFSLFCSPFGRKITI